jgi:hypothetical protein
MTVYDLPECFHEFGALPPNAGAQPLGFLGRPERWGTAATAHQAAQPQRDRKFWLLPLSRQPNVVRCLRYHAE